jgi:hypothetical protein
MYAQSEQTRRCYLSLQKAAIEIEMTLITSRQTETTVIVSYSLFEGAAVATASEGRARVDPLASPSSHSHCEELSHRLVELCIAVSVYA